MFQTVLLIISGVAALAYLIYKYYPRTKNDCGSGCNCESEGVKIDQSRR